MTLLWQTNTSQTPDTPLGRGTDDNTMVGGDKLDQYNVLRDVNGNEKSDIGWRSHSGAYQLAIRFGRLQLLKVSPPVPSPPVLWESANSDVGITKLEMQTDGNLVARNDLNQVQFQTSTSTVGSIAALLDDGNLGVFSS